jgi:hypothetical protein
VRFSRSSWHDRQVVYLKLALHACSLEPAVPGERKGKSRKHRKGLEGLARRPTTLAGAWMRVVDGKLQQIEVTSLDGVDWSVGIL